MEVELLLAEQSAHQSWAVCSMVAQYKNVRLFLPLDCT